MEQILAALQEEFPTAEIACYQDERKIIHLSGRAESWKQLVDIGHSAAKKEGVRNVVNNMTVPGLTIPEKDYSGIIAKGKALGEFEQTDILIIGAGVSGCGVARELSKYNAKIIVVEKGEDVSGGTTKANNGHVHPGNAVKPGTLKAKLNIEGNRLYDKWAQELGFELQRCGSLGVLTDESYLPYLQEALKIGQINGVDGIEIVDQEKAYELEPRLKEDNVKVAAALYLPSTALIEPYKVTVALAENAAENGVKFIFDCEVGDIITENREVKGAVTSKGIIKAKYIINAAGVYADEISKMAGDNSYTIHPRKGVIAILDKNAKPMYNMMTTVIDPSKRVGKNEESKGGGMCRTPEWNILMGPSATEIPDKTDDGTTTEDLEYAMRLNENPDAGYKDIIRMFAGVRAADYKEDFVIEMSDVTDRFINVGAMQSPGLAAAPAVAKMVENILTVHAEKAGTPLTLKKNYNPIRKREIAFNHLSREEQNALIEKDPRYGRVICRCETITEGEIIDAIHSPVVPISIDAIKRRTRAGMGRCQGGFCQARVLEILANELGKDWVDITLKGKGSEILLQDNREVSGR